MSTVKVSTDRGSETSVPDHSQQGFLVQPHPCPRLRISRVLTLVPMEYSPSRQSICQEPGLELSALCVSFNPHCSPTKQLYHMTIPVSQTGKLRVRGLVTVLAPAHLPSYRNPPTPSSTRAALPLRVPPASFISSAWKYFPPDLDLLPKMPPTHPAPSVPLSCLIPAWPLSLPGATWR